MSVRKSEMLPLLSDYSMGKTDYEHNHFPMAVLKSELIIKVAVIHGLKTLDYPLAIKIHKKLPARKLSSIQHIGICHMYPA